MTIAHLHPPFSTIGWSCRCGAIALLMMILVAVGGCVTTPAPDARALLGKPIDPITSATAPQRGSEPKAPPATALSAMPLPDDLATAPPVGDQSRSQGEFQRGHASWYGPRFHGRRTANGERFDMGAMTAAHKTLPFGTRLRVRSLVTGQEVQVRVNDRGPFIRGRIIDLSRSAAIALGLLQIGVKEVQLFVLSDDIAVGQSAVRPVLD